jgi:Protein of unknown function DUF2834
VDRKNMYLLLCVIGFILPYSQFVPWVMQNGLNLGLFVQQLFANRIGAFFGMDVIVSAIVLFRFVRVEGKRVNVRYRWASVIATLTVGVSLGLPLFLYLRERALQTRSTV